VEKKDFGNKMGRKFLKKGQTGEDTIYLVVILFALVIGFMVIKLVYPSISSQMTNQTGINNNTLAVNAINTGNTVVNMLDWFSLVIFIGFVLAFVVLGFFVEAHSVFMIIYIIVMVIGVVISAVISYVFGFIKESSFFDSMSMPITTHLMTYLPIYYTLAAFIALVVTFAKTREQ
jgi:hypothetical protein